MDVPREVALRLKQDRAIVYPKAHKLAYPFRRKEELLPVALGAPWRLE